jgi:hypothetical protein
MKESGPENKKKSLEDRTGMNRRDFLKFGVATVAVGAAAYKFDKFLENNSTELKEHTKQGEAVVLKKGIWNSKGMPPMKDHALPYRGVDICYIILKINDKETRLDVPDKIYDKYNIGDSVSVKYDERSMEVEEILRNGEENKK